MAQIYSEQGIPERAPMAPETQRLTWAEAARKEGVQRIDDAAKGLADDVTKMTAEAKAKAEAERVNKSRVDTAQKAQDDLIMKSLLQIHKNGKELYPKDEAAYQEFVEKGTAPIWSAIDPKDQVRYRAEISIDGSGYAYQVKKGQIDREERIGIENANTRADIEMDKLKNTAGVLIADANMLPEEKAKQVVAMADWNYKIDKLAYVTATAKDQNGNNVYSDAQITVARDMLQNKGYYAVTDWAGKNIASNREGVVGLLESMKNDPKEAQKKYGFSNEGYARTVKDLTAVVDGQITVADLNKIKGKELMATMQVEGLAIDVTGTITGKGKNNLNSVMAAQLALSDALNNGGFAVGPEREKAAVDLAKTNIALNKMIEGKYGVVGERNGVEKFFGWGEKNAGEVLVETVKAHVKDIADIQHVKPEELNDLKAAWYSKAWAGMVQVGIKPDEKGSKINNEAVTGIVNGLLVDYVDANVAKVTLDDEQKKNPKMIKNAVNRVLYQEARAKEKETVDSIIEQRPYRPQGKEVLPGGSSNIQAEDTAVASFLQGVGVYRAAK